MSHNLNALKRLGKKVTGHDVKGDDIKEVLDDFTANFDGGGGNLEPATASKLGGVKVGEGVNVTADGTISVTIPSELPTVTAADNGKVLTVVNGEWKAVLPE